jgi:replicative DNA helicase
MDRYTSRESRLREVSNIAEVIIAKQRMGPIGVEKLSFNPELTRFTYLSRSLYLQPQSGPVLLS